jgi:hypothetical protein
MRTGTLHRQIRTILFMMVHVTASYAAIQYMYVVHPKLLLLLLLFYTAIYTTAAAIAIGFCQCRHLLLFGAMTLSQIH